jgi:Rrf2 family transcriptional regulator, nitric oxide-sensitive transcriptional repressor
MIHVFGTINSIMQLTQYTDYSLRVLIYLSLQPARVSTISEIADFYGISRNHLVKVVHRLGMLGYIETIRGKHGGMRLARPAAEISVGEVARHTEPNFDIAECFDREANQCSITPVCRLKKILLQARTAFLETLDSYTIADAISDRRGALSMLVPIPALAKKGQAARR